MSMQADWLGAPPATAFDSAAQATAAICLLARRRHGSLSYYRAADEAVSPFLNAALSLNFLRIESRQAGYALRELGSLTAFEYLSNNERDPRKPEPTKTYVRYEIRLGMLGCKLRDLGSLNFRVAD
ncbi:hypothetical protein [Pseudomonas sp. CGJS7]|uniref:hypothetical protein n=1 Tax=Pseudomonas sp. CGJS7 TaxID=3109348 RepID=UPI00300882AE